MVAIRRFLCLALLAASLALPRADEPGIRGRVTAGGRPVPEAQVRRLPDELQPLCTARFFGSMDNLAVAAGTEWGFRDSGAAYDLPIHSADDGSFTIPVLQESPAVLLVTAAGFAPALAIARGTEEAQILLDRGNDVTVRAVSIGGQPAVDAQGKLVPLSVCGAAVQGFGRALSPAASAGEDGILRWDHVPDGTYAVKLEARGSAVTTVAPLVVRDATADYRVRLPAGRAALGAVSFSDANVSESGAVLAYWKESSGALRWAGARFSAADPNWVLDGLPEKTSFNLVARAENGWRTPASVRTRIADSAAGLSLRLEPPADWPGTIDPATGVERLMVELAGQERLEFAAPPEAVSVDVDPDGRFTVPGVAADVRSLKFVALGYGRGAARLDGAARRGLGRVLLEQSPTSEGRLVSEPGRPIRGAQIIAFSGSEAYCSTMTDVEGRFGCSWTREPSDDVSHLARLGDGVIRLRPTAKGKGEPSTFRPAARVEIGAEVVSAETRSPIEEVMVSLQPTDRVSARSLGGETPIFYAHAPLGELEVPLPSFGGMKVWVGYPGNMSSRTRGTPGRRMRFELPPAAAVRGSVLSSHDELPIADAEVELLTDADSRAPLLGRIARSDFRGEWGFEQVSAESCKLIAASPGYASATLRVLASDTASHRLLLGQPASIRGTVVGLETQARSSVHLMPGSVRDNAGDRSTGVDSQGLFEFRGLRPGSYSILFTATSPDSDGVSRFLELSLEPGEVREIVINLSDQVVLSGRAYLGDRPLDSVHLSFEPVLAGKEPLPEGSLGTVSTRADEEGRFEVALARPGQYEVKAFLLSLTLVGQSRLELEIEEGEQEEDLRFSTGEVRGRLVDREGRPVTDAQIMLWGRLAEDRKRRFGATDWRMLAPLDHRGIDRDGSFSFPGLSPSEYQLSVTAKGFAAQKTDPVQVGRDASMNLGDIVLEEGRVFKVVAAGPEGQGLRGAHVAALHPGDFRRLDVASVRTGPEGEAALRLSDGVYTMVALFIGLPPAIADDVEVTDESRNQTLNLSFTRGGTLAIQALGPDGAPRSGVPVVIIDRLGRDVTPLYEGLNMMSRRSPVTNADGELLLEAMLPGVYSIEAHRPWRGRAASTTVVEGMKSSVVLEVK